MKEQFLKFSFFMMPIHQPKENPSLAFDRDIKLVNFADMLGFDEFFIGEHHSGGWENMPCPEMALAKASATAKRIKLGTSVINLPFHHPYHVAERIVFLDHLTMGRAMLGVGPSSLISDKRLFRINPDVMWDMMQESLEIIINLLDKSEPFDFDGKFWKLKDIALQLHSFQKPRIPICIATAGSEETLDLAGKHGCVLFSMAGKSREGKLSFSDQWSRVEKSALQHGTSVSRDNWRVVTSVYLSENRQKAWDEVEEGIAREMNYFKTIGFKSAYEDYSGQPFDKITPRIGAKNRRWIIGTPDDAIGAIEEFIKETGGFGGFMMTTHEWTSEENIRHSIDLFARYVMPHFRNHTSQHISSWNRLQQDFQNKKSPDFDSNLGFENVSSNN